MRRPLPRFEPTRPRRRCHFTSSATVRDDPTMALAPAPTPSAAVQDLPDQGTGAPSAVSYALGGPRAIQPWLQGQLAVLNGVSGLPDRSASAISIGSTRPNCTACAPAPVRASTAFHAGPVITSVPARDRAAIQRRTYPRRRPLAHFAVFPTCRGVPTTAPAPVRLVGANRTAPAPRKQPLTASRVLTNHGASARSHHKPTVEPARADTPAPIHALDGCS